MNRKHIVEKLQSLAKRRALVLVAIDGRSGSGKSSLAKMLVGTLKNSKVIHLDEFDMYEEENVQRVVDEVIKPLKLTDKSQIVILDGVFSLHSKLEPYYDYKIWIDCPVMVGYKRGLKRDIDYNGIDNSDKWEGYWLPKEEAYIRKEEPREKADCVIDGSK